MVSWPGDGEDSPPQDSESKEAIKVQEEKLKDTLSTVYDVHKTASRSRHLLNTDLLAIAIERSMGRA